MTQTKQNKKLQITKRVTKRPIQRQRHLSSSRSPHAIIQRVQGDPQKLSQEDVLQLQRTMGNRATMNILQRKKSLFERFFGTSRSSSSFSAAPRSGMSGSQEAQALMSGFSRQLRRERKARVSFIYHNYRSAAAEQKKADESKDPSNRRSNRIPFTNVILNDMAWAFFREHAKTEYSVENPMFLDFALDRSKISGTSSPSGLKHVRESITNRQAMAIVNTFVRVGSKYEINIDSKNRSNLVALMDKTAKRINQNRSEMRQRSGPSYRGAPVSVEDGSEMGSAPSYKGAPVLIENWDTTADPELLGWIDKAIKEIIHLCRDSHSRFLRSETAMYAEKAINDNARVSSWVSQYQPFMDLYTTSKSRSENTKSKRNTKWWQW